MFMVTPECSVMVLLGFAQAAGSHAVQIPSVGRGQNVINVSQVWINGDFMPFTVIRLLKGQVVIVAAGADGRQQAFLTRSQRLLPPMVALPVMVNDRNNPPLGAPS